MIDDFSKPPSRGAKGRPNKPNDEEEFFPDLSQATPVEPSFVTPEEVAAQDEVDETIDLSDDSKNGPGKPELPDSKPPKSSKERWWNRLGGWFKRLNKKQKALVVILILVLLGGISGGIYALVAGESPVEQATKTQPKPKSKSTTVASNLTGLQVQPALNEKPVTGVMIENSVEARPQAGLLEAGVVFEAIAEGGITRFLALYQDTAPDSIGPVRSARPYYLDWALGFDAAYAHVGGSPEALQRIKSEDVKDLDQSFNAGSFQRVSNRYSPHNVFTSIAKLNELEQSKGYGKSNFTSFQRKKDQPSTQPVAKNINLAISSIRYNVQYTYDATTNTYLRSMGNAAHTDETTSKQISPKVVIAMVMNYRIASDGKHSIYNTVGSGQVYVFQDGNVTEGTWEKTATNKQIVFTDAAGKPIRLNAGQTWITAINSAGSASYQP